MGSARRGSNPLGVDILLKPLLARCSTRHLPHNTNWSPAESCTEAEVEYRALAPVAQWIARQTSNLEVAGSSPAWGVETPLLF
jgi:hypothetical protein